MNMALELAASLRPLLVLLDVNLPDMSGLEVCRKIKSDPELGSTLVLQVSASAVTSGDRVGGLDNGADGYLVEPVDSGSLVGYCSRSIAHEASGNRIGEGEQSACRMPMSY